MQKVLTLVLIFIFFAACKNDGKLPKGFELVSQDSSSYFLHMEKKYMGNRVKQREVGRIICKQMFKKLNYCEVYFFNDKSKIPNKFPIVNRIDPIGKYEFKSGKETFKALKEFKMKKI